MTVLVFRDCCRFGGHSLNFIATSCQSCLTSTMDYNAAIAALSQADPVLAPLIDAYAPYPVNSKPPVETTLSALAKAIFYQSISVQSATAVYQRFLALYEHQQFPSAQEILDTDATTLRQIGLSRAKIHYLKATATQATIDLPNLDTLKDWNNEAIIKCLTSIKGIGCWSVEMVLIFQLKRPNILPVNDLGIRAAIRDLYQLEQLPDITTVKALGEKWRPYRTIATWYLWQSRNAATRALLQAWT